MKSARRYSPWIGEAPRGVITPAIPAPISVFVPASRQARAAITLSRAPYPSPVISEAIRPIQIVLAKPLIGRGLSILSKVPRGQESSSQIYNTGYLTVSPHWRWRDREAIQIPASPVMVEIIEKKEKVSRSIEEDRKAVQLLRAEIADTKKLIADKLEAQRLAELQQKISELDQIILALAQQEMLMMQLEEQLKAERLRQVAIMIFLLES